MSSTNKTSNLQLNSWIGSDRPQRTDFNYDNEVIDNAISQHTGDTVSHITESEREKWNSMVYHGIYFGTGASTRTVDTGCPFKASFGMVFADSRPISIVRFSENKKYNYMGFFGSNADSLGVSLNDDGKTLVVRQSSGAEVQNEYASLNESGVGYQYIMFR